MVERDWAVNDSVNRYLDGSLLLHEESQEMLTDGLPVLGYWFQLSSLKFQIVRQMTIVVNLVRLCG
jgi:hypothetical protein